MSLKRIAARRLWGREVLSDNVDSSNLRNDKTPLLGASAQARRGAHWGAAPPRREDYGLCYTVGKQPVNGTPTVVASERVGGTGWSKGPHERRDRTGAAAEEGAERYGATMAVPDSLPGSA